MEISKLFGLLACILLLAGCEVSHTIRSAVEIPGSTPADEKLKAAEEISKALWDGPLKATILSEVKDASKEDLDSNLGLQWNTTTFKSATDAKNDKTIVQIICLHKSKGKSETGNAIIASCKAQVEQAIRARFNEPPQ